MVTCQLHAACGSAFKEGVALASWERVDEAVVSDEIALEISEGVVFNIRVGELDDEAEPMSAGNPEWMKWEENIVIMMSSSERILFFFPPPSLPGFFLSKFQKRCIYTITIFSCHFIHSGLSAPSSAPPHHP